MNERECGTSKHHGTKAVDPSGRNMCPAVIVSSSGYNANRRDLVIMAITSQVRALMGFGEALIADWQAAGLIKPFAMKPVFTAIQQSLVVRSMGRLAANDLRTLRETLAQVIS